MQNTIQFIPETNVPSEIFNNIQLMELYSRLPYYHQYSNLRLIYSIAKDGCLLKTFYQKVQNEKNLIFAINFQMRNLIIMVLSLEQENVFYILFIKKIEFMFIILQALMNIIYMVMIIKLLLVVLMIILV